MYNILIILKGSFFVFLVYIASYIIEKVSLLKLLIDGFLWKKSTNMAKGAAIFNSIFVFFLTTEVVHK